MYSVQYICCPVGYKWQNLWSGTAPATTATAAAAVTSESLQLLAIRSGESEDFTAYLTKCIAPF